ncbi:hypothetical protein L2E82_17446 [Cichorium intybus]|uniref:Uncharacterized protein n=1 Tax=Cichorium intybus TaxID=13427 RepID=A0ACB9F9I3_CICIN|nr:hypothetical protein L2E82_17446 [Cichorium intybus]
MDYITSNVETIISYDLEAETYELKFTSRLCIDNAKRIAWTKLMCSIRSPKVISRIGNRETEYRTEIDLNPCLVSENILLDERSYDHLSMDRTDWVRVRQQFLGSYRRLLKVSNVTLGGYKRRHLATLKPAPLSPDKLCWTVFSIAVAGKEHVNTVEAEWRKVTLEDLLDSGSKEEPEKKEEVQEKAESKKEEGRGEKEIPIEEGTQPKVDEGVHEEEQSVIAGIKQRKKDKKGKKKQEAPKSIGPLMNQPLWDELKDAPEDTRILQEMCERNEKGKIPTPDTVRLTIKASEALLGTLRKKEKDPGSPLITTTVGDVVIRNTLLDLGASVNVLPGYLYDKYKNEALKPAKVVLQLADQSTKYESLDDAPALILGRPFLATAGAVIDCKTGDVDISFGTRKRRLNMFGNPVSLPSGNDDKQADKNVLMEPGMRNKEKIWTRTGEGGKEEILKETKNHLLATIEKEQLLEMMEMLEARHQQYEKESREREAKVFKLLESQQQWISGVSDRMTQLTSLISMMAQNFIQSSSKCHPEFKKKNRECATRDSKPTRCARVDLVKRATRESIGRFPLILRLDHQFLQFPAELDSSVEYISRRDALVGRRVLEATVIDRDILRDAGLWGEIELFLHRTWTHEDASFTCRGWDRLMATQDDTVYTEVLLEFLSTVRFAPGSQEVFPGLYVSDWGCTQGV